VRWDLVRLVLHLYDNNDIRYCSPVGGPLHMDSTYPTDYSQIINIDELNHISISVVVLCHAVSNGW
jgi:hypothetical protein